MRQQDLSVSLAWKPPNDLGLARGMTVAVSVALTCEISPSSQTYRANNNNPKISGRHRFRVFDKSDLDNFLRV